MVGNDQKGIVTTALPRTRDEQPTLAAIQDGLYLILNSTGLNAVDNIVADALSDKKVQYTRDGAPYATTTFTHNDVSVILEPGASIPIGRKLTLSMGLRYQLAFNYQEESPLKFSRIGARHQRFGLRLGLSSEF